MSKARAAPSKRASFQVSAALQEGRRLWAPGIVLQLLRAPLLAPVSPKRSHCTRFPKHINYMPVLSAHTPCLYDHVVWGQQRPFRQAVRYTGFRTGSAATSQPSPLECLPGLWRVSVSHSYAISYVLLWQQSKGGTANASVRNEGFLGRARKASSEVFPGVLQESRHPNTSMATLPETMAGTHLAWEQTLRG